MVRAIATTLQFDQDTQNNQSDTAHSINSANCISETAQDGYQISYQVSKEPVSVFTSPKSEVASRSGDATPTSSPRRAEIGRTNDQQIVRVQSNDLNQLKEDLQTLVEQPSASVVSSVAKFDSSACFQAAIAAVDEDDISKIARALLDGPVSQNQTSALPRHCGWFRNASDSGSRVGWLFPGQGSQYAAVPDLLSPGSQDPNKHANWNFLKQFDSLLKQRGLESVSDRLTDPQGQLGRDIWWTQLWVLAAGTTMANDLMQRGHRPDVVLGHSFGECTAAWCAGVMSLDQAIQFAKYRSDAVVMTHQAGGELLSVRGEPSAVQAVLDRNELDAVISHHNSPVNTVVAGSKEEIEATKKMLSAAGLACVSINVPAAFHTSKMQPARDLLRTRFANQRLSPPRFGFLSAVSNRYLAEPNDVMDNLVDQLTQPVSFSGATERMVEDGCGLLIEVGPDNVLTRLARTTVHGKAICLSADDRTRDHQQQQCLIDLAMEAFRGDEGTANERKVTTSNAIDRTTSEPTVSSSRSSQQEATQVLNQFEIVDVTRRKRQREASSEASVDRVPGYLNNGNAPQLKRPSTNEPSIETVTNADPNGFELTQPNATADIESARSFLFDLVVDLTGYDPEIIDFEADLEGELGVDSIKKAQLIGEVVQWGDLQVDTQSMQLAQFATLDDILGLVGSTEEQTPDPLNRSSIDHDSADSISRFGASHGSLDALTTETNVQTINQDIALQEEDNDFEFTNDSDLLRRLMIDLVVDQTGYDESIIDMDADLEGELGVDSIKKAQLLGELEQQYQLQSLRDSGLTLADFPTLESIHSFVWEQISVGEESNTQVAEDEKKNETRSDLVSPGDSNANTSPVPDSGTHRFALAMHDAPRLAGMPTQPTFSGSALVIGDNLVADAIIKRWTSSPETSHLDIYQIKSGTPAGEVELHLDRLWQDGVSPHLFITTPHDDTARWSAMDSTAWEDRRESALLIPYRVCQRWMQGLIDEDQMGKASLATLIRSGGHFGFSNSDVSSTDTLSAESGGLSGLTKAMLIECWMRGYQDTPMLVVDAIEGASPSQYIDGVWRELAAASYDEEVAVTAEQRLATCARYMPLSNERKTSVVPLLCEAPVPGKRGPTPFSGTVADTPHKKHPTRYPLTKGGTWIVAGGGRGITAMTAMELASRHNLKLHLLGTAPSPQIDDMIRQSAAADRGDLRRRVMTQVQSKGGNPVKAWQKLEKAIEIDQTLQACEQRSISATYHSVDVSDANAVQALLEQIRKIDGPIHGVIQGAGAGQDSRFDRKRPDKVEKCFRAKIDGCIALAEATKSDPLEWFIGFGSISGRFGANGHTDYSAANDMLAKLTSKLNRERPETRCVTFHWHAWGDIGMATKPEAKLALDMIGMKFMPAEEGLSHFINEIEQGGDLAEVLITDRRYVRKFFPGGEHYGLEPDHLASPMLFPNGSAEGRKLSGSDTPETEKASDPLEAAGEGQTPFRSSIGKRSSYVVTLNPVSDRFLSEHLVQGRPTLPFVMALEMLAEAATSATAHLAVSMHDVKAHQPLKCLSDDSFAVELVRDDSQGKSLFQNVVDEATSPNTERSHSRSRWSLQSDLRRRDGRLVQAGRPHFSASIETSLARPQIKLSDNELATDVDIKLEKVAYQPIDAPVYHGPQLQCLRRIGFDEARQMALGLIVAPSPAHLAGEDRPLQGWCLSPASMDAVLYAAGMLAYRLHGKPSLPISFDEIQLGRLPVPGEPMRVVVCWERTASWNETTFNENTEINGGQMSAVLAGQNCDMILKLSGYQVGWLG